MKIEHKSTEELIDYLDNPLGTDKDKSVEEHLAECDKCVSELSIIEGFRSGLKKFGKNAQEQVTTGSSKHLQNDQLSKYVNESCNRDEKIAIMYHIAGCNSCLEDVFALSRLSTELEQEPSLIKRSILLGKFITSNPDRLTAVKNEANGLISNAAHQGIALFEIGRSFSFAFKSDNTDEKKYYKEYKKMDTDNFMIELIHIENRPSKIIIGITAKYDLEQATVTTICKESEISDIVTLDNRRAVILKENIRFEDVRYIKAEKI